MLIELCEYEESLNDTNLKGLAISNRDGLWDSSSLIPFKSARTLLKLHIIDFQYFEFDEENSLDSLPNLTDLELVPLVDGFLKFWITTKMKLLHFTTEIALADPSAEEVSEIFSSSCFRQLQSLTLNHADVSSYSDEYWRYNEASLTLITRHLRTLDTLELYMAMDISWCSSFVNLFNLKTLTWGIREDLKGRPISMDGSD